jgi:hypothetical protein
LLGDEDEDDRFNCGGDNSVDELIKLLSWWWNIDIGGDGVLAKSILLLSK